MTGELLALLGAFLMFISAWGVVRFPDSLSQMHALSKASTLGILLVLGGAAVNLARLHDVTVVAMAAVLHLLVMPPSSNMLSRAAYLTGATGRREVVDEGAEALGLERDEG